MTTLFSYRGVNAIRRSEIFGCVALLFVTLNISSFAAAAAPDRMQPGAPNPADAIKTFELPDGFVIELVAAEPLVMDPVAFAWGPDGKFWVVEMADYNHLPVDDADPNRPRGRVVYLTDSDNDGTYDKRHVFLDDLNYPNGVLPWRDGVLITAAPDILFASDTTPDDDNFKADKREVLFTGFNEGNPQLRINGLAWGLDNWIYCANGLSHGKVKSTKTGKVIDISGRDVRIRPDTGEIEHATGPSQFGRVRDDFGNWFGCNNSELIRHYVLPDHYLRRNPHVKYPDPVVSLVQPRNPPLFARGERVERFHAPYMAGRFTSACGLHIYRDTLLGDGYYHNAFICEPVHNLITRRVLTPDGVTFKATRANGEEQREWLTSTDNWFRPAMVRTGPDGAIWIADMYRAVIEHAQWAPKEVHELFALRHGHERGRIYRVYRKANLAGNANENKENKEKDAKLEGDRRTLVRRFSPAILAGKPAISTRMDRMDYKELSTLLGDRNGYVRDLAHMSLVGRVQLADADDVVKRFRVKEIRHALTETFGSSATAKSNSLANLHALALLDALGELTANDFEAHPLTGEPAIHRHRYRFAEQWSADEASAVFAEKPAEDAAAQLQFALSVGTCSADAAGVQLAALMLQSHDDPYLLAAIMSSATPHLRKLSDQLLYRDASRLPDNVLESLAQSIVADADIGVLTLALSRAASEQPRRVDRWQFVVLASLLDALASRGKSLEKLEYSSDPAALRSAVARTNAMLAWICDRDRFMQLTASDQIAAARLLGRSTSAETDDSDLLITLLRPTQTSALQQAAIDAIARHGDAAIKSLLLDATRWKTFTPALRSRVVSMLMQRSSRIALLLDAVEAGTVNAVEIDAAARQQLIASKTATIRDRAAKLLGNRQTDRAKLVAAFADVLTMPGDTARGRVLYEKTCAACHRLAGEGKGVAPDLSSLSDRSTKFMLENILDPNAAVDSRYINYICETAEGDTLTGMLVSETGGSLTLVGPNGDRHVILRRDVISLRSTNLSLMPEGLEAQLGKPGESKQALADVIAYVQYRSQPPRPLVGVKPRVDKPGADGSIVLTCRAVKAFGTAVNYEKEDNNIGNWTSADDYLVWEIEVTQAGKYEVWFDYAADDAWQGNKVSLAASNEAGETGRLQAELRTTGSQDRYVQRKLGEIELAAGMQTLTLRAVGKISGELLDLRGVRLTPVK